MGLFCSRRNAGAIPREGHANLPKQQIYYSENPTTLPTKKLIAHWFLRLNGWTVEGERPKHTRFVFIAAPHTSTWDFLYMLAFATVFDVKMRWLAKHSLFNPPMGPIMRALGGIPIVRHTSSNVVSDMIAVFDRQEALALAVPTEDTRALVEYWKSGFYHIAVGANVPIVPSYLDYGQKRAGFGPALIPTGDIRADMEYFRQFYSTSTGKFPEKFGPYWSITRYEDIMKVDTSHELFSSEPSINIRDQPEDFRLPMFIAMDRPKHDQQRKVVNPVVGADNLRNFEAIIRERTIEVLESLPVGEEFDWVESVSIELTTLFDFPFEDRSLLTKWSDFATSMPDPENGNTQEVRRDVMGECLTYFTKLWNERVNEPPGGDFISMMIHGEATKDMSPPEYLGNLLLLTVGGNDTTRNTMSGSVLALHQFPEQFAKLTANPDLLPNMISETIRWQTPLAHMRRRALIDTELGGKTIKAGDKVVMWYVSGNRDETFFERPDDYDIERENVRKHLSFGFGIHRCMGNRLAELQVQILWEELLKRFDRVEVVGKETRNESVFVRGYTSLPVKLHPRSA